MKTKQLLLTAVIMCAVFSIKSQTYYPFISDNKIWSIVNGNGWYGYATDFTKLDGDTVIDGKDYKFIYHCYEPSMMNWDKDEYSFIREDIDNKRVYTYNDSSEVLLYDFSLMPGDSFYTGTPDYETGGDSLYAFVKTVDSVLIHGVYRKRIIFDTLFNDGVFNEVWIEGLGSLTAPFAPFVNLINYSIVNGPWSYLICVKENDNMIYQNSNQGSCYVNTNIFAYHPFINVFDEKIWVVGISSWWNSTVYYKLEGDTIINSKNYKFIYTTLDSTFTNWTKNEEGYIREDVNTRRVYEYCNDGYERLLYDFSLMQGDSFYNGCKDDQTGDSLYTTVDSIDYVWINGANCKIINGNIIESIGNTGYPFFVADGYGYCMMIFDWYPSLLCVKENGNTIYQNPDYGVCYFGNTSVKEIKDDENTVRIYPNPSSTSATITISDEQNRYNEIKVLDIQGQVVKRDIINDNTYILNTSDMIPGMYFIFINDNKDNVLKSKIIVE